MEKSYYSCPTIEILSLSNTDVIITSPFLGEDGNDIFDD